MAPRNTVSPPVAVLAVVVGAKVSTPSPVFCKPKVPTSPLAIRPEKVELRLSDPTTKVAAVVPWMLFNVPAPEREPTRVSNPLSETVAPELISKGANGGVARVAPIRRVPPETTSGPEKEEIAEERTSVPPPAFVRE